MKTKDIFEKKRCLDENTSFRTLLTALMAGGFDSRHAYDLRRCMERGWGFRRVSAALEKKGSTLDFPTKESRQNAEERYQETMELLVPYFRYLHDVLKVAGFDERGFGNQLVASLKANHGFGQFRISMDRLQHPLRFREVRGELDAERAYDAIRSHGRSLIDPSIYR